MSLDLEIQALLRSNEVKQIDFSMRGMRVTGHGYFSLSNCFSDGAIAHRIRVTVRPQLVGWRNDAVYDPVENKVKLRSPAVLHTLSGRATVVHECTHAQLDLRAHPTPIRSEEGAAFVAEALFMLFCDARLEEIDRQVSEDIRNIAIDLRIRSRGTLRTAEMTAEQINAVRRAMVRFGYETGRYVSDGISGLRYRGL